MMKRWTEKDYLDNIRCALDAGANKDEIMRLVENYAGFLHEETPDCDNCEKKRGDGPSYNEGHE